MKKLTLSAIAAILTMVGLSGVAMISPASAEGVVNQVICPDGTKSNDGTYKGCSADQGGVQGQQDDLMGVLNVVINVVLGVVGFVAVAMIIMGGISYTTSQGDAAKTTKARNTILYGVVGLVIALLAFAIVNFVLSNVFGGNA